MKNPVIKGWYADPEARVYNGKVLRVRCRMRSSII